MTRPQRSTLRWLLATAGLTIATVVGNITYNVLAEKVNTDVGPFTWAIPGLGLVVTGVLAGLELRWRAQGQHEGGEPPPVHDVSSGALTDLPYTSGFVGREHDVAWVAGALRTEHAVAVLGRRAVGTSACAVQAANLVRDEFEHGQPYLDLRAGGRRRLRWRRRGERAMRPREVLAALAAKLDVPPPASGRAADLAATAAALRASLADRRVLLVLDNVSDPDQVRELLPPAPGCRLLMAGTPALSTLDGVAVRWLSEPSRADAVKLFAAAAASAPSLRARQQDPATDPAVPELVELCGRQPRVVRALGWQVARHGWRSAELLTTLRRAVAAPAHERAEYAAALDLLCRRDLAYRALSRPARRLFRLLSLTSHPLSRDAVAALTGRSRPKVDRLLDELAAAAFVVAASGDRYHARPLLAGYARLHLRRDEPAWRRRRAQTRLVRHLARSAERHTAALAVTSPTPASGGPHRGGDDPQAWFELHQELLREQVDAPVRRWWFRLAVALAGWCAYRDDLDAWAAVCRAALARVGASGRSSVAGWAYNELGVIARRTGDAHAAAVELTRAVAHRRRRGAAQSRTNLGLALLDQGEVDAAIEHLEWARRHRSPADRAGQALTDLGLGAAYLARGQPGEARHHLVRAANRFEALADRRGYAAALTNLALAYWWLGEHLDATLAANAAVREHDRIDDLRGRAAALLNAGAALADGEKVRAEQAYRLLAESARLRADWRPSAGLGRTLLYLGDAAHACARPDEAREHWTEAADICEEAGDRNGAAAARRRLDEHAGELRG
ncbi:MAG: tetratricopeptide repeat protein [Micromonosporaceae bacterium]|jgi:tetratricopeptide (TPR) repeat protein|nr:tetratricopeptide repeat protein [Micromonosporaceae bacterium]